MIDLPEDDGERGRRSSYGVRQWLGQLGFGSVRARRRFLPILSALLGSWLLLQAFGALSLNLEVVTLRLQLRAPGSGLTEASIPPVGRIQATTHKAPIDFVVTLEELSLDALEEFLRLPSAFDLSSSQPGPPPGGTARGAAKAYPVELGANPSDPAAPGSAVPEPLDARLSRLSGLAAVEGKPPFPAEQVARWVQPELRSTLLRFALRTALVVAVGGGLGALLVGRRRALTFAKGAGVSLLALALVGVPAAVTYETAGFASPRYEGVLEAAPWMVGAVQESLEQVDELGDQLALIAANLYRLFSQIQTLEPLTSRASDLVLLHVSDIHNNSAAFDFIDSVVEKFDVTAIVDTGDLTDWGTPIEARIIERVDRLELPYIFVSGNHETPRIVRRLDTLSHVRVLGGIPHGFAIASIEIDGLRISGIADPGADESSPEALDPERAALMADAIEAQIAASSHKPDVFAVHNHRVGQALSPMVAPVILYGHDHQLRVQATEEQVRVDAGTTGAAGIRGLSTPEGVPYTMALLYFDRIGQGWHLKAVDTLSISGLEGRFRLERYAFDPPTQQGHNRAEER